MRAPASLWPKDGTAVSLGVPAFWVRHRSPREIGTQAFRNETLVRALPWQPTAGRRLDAVMVLKNSIIIGVWPARLARVAVRRAQMRTMPDARFSAHPPSPAVPKINSNHALIFKDEFRAPCAYPLPAAVRRWEFQCVSARKVWRRCANYLGERTLRLAVLLPAPTALLHSFANIRKISITRIYFRNIYNSKRYSIS